MVNFTVDQIRAVMENTDNIRNMSVIAHVDHGKSTLTDSLVAKAGIISAESAGNKRFTDIGELEQQKGITIKSTGVSLYYEQDVHHNGTKGKYLFNLIDSPGHVDFSSEVTAALRVTDGALVVVDCVEGVCVQTETVLRQAMQEKIKPVLFVNKIDKLFDLAHEPEVMYQAFVRAIDMANVVIANYEQPDMGDLTLHPSLGNVAFGSGKNCWGFTLDVFARMYSKRFNIDEKKMMDKLWGDNYFDAEAKKWKTENVSESGVTLQRAFVAFILEPIIKLTKAVMEDREEDMNKLLTKLEVSLTSEDRKLKGKDLLRIVMSKWINAGDCLIEMMVKHLPSPKTAQKYRAAYLYEGPLDDPCGEAIKNCDPSGPLTIYISKMIPNADYSRFMAFGRVFSGTVANGMKVKILPPNHRPGTKSEVFEKNVTRTMIMMGKEPANVNDVPAGCIVALMGVDQHIVKSATITTHPEAYNIRGMKYSVAPVVRVAVEPKNQTDLPKLVEGLRKLSKSDQLVQVSLEDNGQHVIAGSGELHIETVLHDLMNEYAKCPIKTSDPIVNYRETITTRSAQTCLAKSANGHNRLFCTAEPLEEAVVKAIETDKYIRPNDDIKHRAKILSEEFGWDRNDAQKLWCFGPENTGANVIVDQSKGLQGLDEIRDSIETSFQLFTKNGALCEESLSGVRINIVDAMIHADNAHRGPSQIIQAARRVCYASQLVSQPRIFEPVFMAEVTTPLDAVGGVYQCINARRGQVVEQNQVAGTPMQVIRAYLPVAESFGFAGHLRALTAGQAFPQCIFDHWEVVKGDPYEAGSKVNQLVESIRKRKGLKAGLPLVSEYLDRL